MGVHVREKPKGSGVWWVFINHQGKRKSKKVGTEDITREVAEKIRAKLILGELNVEKINRKCPVFKEYSELWLALPHGWKESTVDTYRANLEKHVYPVFGKVHVDKIQRKDLNIFFDKLLVKGMAPKTVGLVKSTINGILDHALESDVVDDNPCVNIKVKGRNKKFEVDPLTEPEVNQVLEQAQLLFNGRHYPTILCLLRTGMRIGEVQALKWTDIDFDKAFIEVKRSFRDGRITDPKNKKYRKVDISPQLSSVLKDTRIDKKKLAFRKGIEFSEYVFASKKQKIFNRVVFHKVFKEIIKKADIKRNIRVHDLRHSYATIRLLKGHNIGDISYQLGHSSVKITYDVYGHWVPGMFKNEVAELDGTDAPKRTLYASKE